MLVGDGRVVDCPHCGVANELPAEALAVGRFRCHACGEVSAVPRVQQPRETPATHGDAVQTEPSFVVSQQNTPEAMRRAEVEASTAGCLLGPLLLLLGAGGGG